MIETQQPRTTPQFGMVKSGANYVMALGPTMRAKREVGADQVLFAPDGKIQETGAANFLMIDAGQIITPALSEAFLHGVTRDSVLALGADLGYHVEQHDSLTVDELLAWSRRDDAEAALSGTAAVLASVGSLVVDGEDMAVGSGNVGNETLRLRKALTDVHVGAAEDAHGWLTLVE
jgi:branched-chain amino acid aminotransferase